MDNYVLKEKDLNTNFSQILIEIYTFSDLWKIINFCRKYNYKYIWCIHYAESEEKKEHIHFYIKSCSKHRFIIRSLISDTLAIYNFMKCKTTSLDFALYVMHKNYDFKIKYSFKHLHFGFYTDSEKYKLLAKIDSEMIGTINEDEIYDIDNFTRKLFSYQFTDFKQIIEYCSRSPKLRKYFLIHSRSIFDTWNNMFNIRYSNNE